MAHAPHPTHLCKSITIPYLGMDHLLLSLFLGLLYSHTGEPTISCATSGQTLIVVGHEVVVIPAPWEKFMIILCSHLPISPMTLTIAFDCGRRLRRSDLPDAGAPSSGLRGDF